MAYDSSSLILPVLRPKDNIHSDVISIVPGSIVADWAVVVAAGASAIGVESVNPPLNPETDIIRSTTKLFSRHSGVCTTLIFQFGVPIATTGMGTQLRIAALGRKRSQNGSNLPGTWHLLRNRQGDTYADLNIDVTKDLRDAAMIYSTPDARTQAFDNLGFDEFLVAQLTTPTLVGGSIASAVVRCRQI